MSSRVIFHRTQLQVGKKRRYLSPSTQPISTSRVQFASRVSVDKTTNRQGSSFRRDSRGPINRRSACNQATLPSTPSNHPTRFTHSNRTHNLYPRILPIVSPQPNHTSVHFWFSALTADDQVSPGSKATTCVGRRPARMTMTMAPTSRNTRHVTTYTTLVISLPFHPSSFQPSIHVI